MHIRIPSRIITATLELALLATTITSPTTSASPLSLDLSDLSSLLELSPKHQEQNQHIVGDPSSSILKSNSNSNSKSTSAFRTSSSSNSAVTCSYNATRNPQSSGQSAGLFACISGFETDTWSGGKCGGQEFYKGRNGFWFAENEEDVEELDVGLGKSSGESKESNRDSEGAKECYRECESCLIDAVVDGAAKVECGVRRGVLDVGRCWVGIE